MPEIMVMRVVEVLLLMTAGMLPGYFFGWARGYHLASKTAQDTYYAFIEQLKKEHRERKHFTRGEVANAIALCWEHGNEAIVNYLFGKKP